MPPAFAKFLISNVSLGLLVVSQNTDLLTAIDEILLVWQASEAEEWINQICTIPF